MAVTPLTVRQVGRHTRNTETLCEGTYDGPSLARKVIVLTIKPQHHRQQIIDDIFVPVGSRALMDSEHNKIKFRVNDDEVIFKIHR
ncbi:hypothetical protein HAX54_036121, partial [Datura stramonium]|nr:hypothetical protein [Datura stramonium]